MLDRWSKSFARSAAGILVVSLVATIPSYLLGATARPAKKVSPDAASAVSFAPVAVIIQYKLDPGPEQMNNVQALGGNVTAHFKSIHALGATLPPSLLEMLATSDPSIVYISVDRQLTPRGSSGGDSSVSISSADYFNEPINAEYAWANGFIGTNVGIAVIDSGIQPVADLAAPPANMLPANQPSAISFPKVAGEVAPGQNGRISYSQNFVSTANQAVDQFGHGTHVAGLIAGNGTHSTGNNFTYTYKGVAPNASLVNLRALDQNGAGTDSSVIAAIEQAIALKNTYNIRVINLSLGRPILRATRWTRSARLLSRRGRRASS